ncbi:MAG: adenosylcobinamide-GDP ribazoletransferase, partial [Gammaproteobacteria bacterium]|nr:adenosylcobinamide-GDP ribazoletransferase [Gammaproteobacteria bacterium]
RESGLGTALLAYMPNETILWSVLLVSALAYFIFANIFSMLLVAIVVIALRMMMIQRIGGMTGDTLGATIEIAEAVALIGLVF